MQREVLDFMDQWEDKSACITVQTSGSTGTPKEIQLQKKFMLASAKMTCDFLSLDASKTALVCLSPQTIAGKMMLVRGIYSGMNLLVTTPTSTPFKDIRQPIDFAALVPYQLQQSILSTPEAFFAGQQLIVGGAPVSAPMEETFRALPSSVFHTFGMTETISHIALRSISKGEGSFQPLKDVHAAVHEGCLRIQAPHLGVTDLQTNDVVEMHSDGSFTWLGRSDFAINSGGYKLHPEQIERALSKVISEPFFVAGIPDPQFGHRLVLCIESPDRVLSKASMEGLLKSYEQPKIQRSYNQFVRTTSGKINRLSTLNLDHVESALL